MAKSITREQWLNRVARRMAPWFKEAGYPLPPVRVGVGFTSAGSRSNAIGECWCNSQSEDGVFEIFLVPGLAEATRVADVLAHELIHAAIGIKAGHGALFRKLMREIGLEGKPTATVAGDKFKQRFETIHRAVGSYPHAKLKSHGGPRATPKPKQSTRLIKCECPACGYTVRTTAKWLEFGAPICPADREVMLVP